MNLLAERIAVPKQVGLQIGANHRHGTVVTVFEFGKVAALGHLGIAQRAPIGGAAVQSDIGQCLRSERDGHGAAGAHPKITHQRRVIF